MKKEQRQLGLTARILIQLVVITPALIVLNNDFLQINFADLVQLPNTPQPELVLNAIPWDRALVLLIVIVNMFVLSKISIPLPIPFTSYHVLFPGLIWQTTISYQVITKGQLDQSIVSVLEQNKQLRYEYVIDVSKSQIMLFLVLKWRNYVFPLSKSRVLTKSEALLKRYGIQGLQVKHIKKQHHKLHYFASKSTRITEFPSLSHILDALEKQRVVATLSISTQFEKLFTFKSPINSFTSPAFATTIKIATKDLSGLYILQSLDRNTKIRSRRVVLSLSPKILWQVLNYPKLSSMDPSVRTTMAVPVSNDKINGFGQVIYEQEAVKPFSITLSDLEQGGIIAGAIGTGKTTLRLHLMGYALSKGVRVIDFDLKGDSLNYPELVGAGISLTPNRNFYLSPFLCPEGFNPLEYANILTRSFIETIPDGEALTPPQLSLLTRAIQKTVTQGGNSRDFFSNLFILGFSEQQILDNKQNTTAQALMVRFGWMQSSLANIFWQTQNTLNDRDYASSSMFFDFSELAKVATYKQVRFVINLIMARIMVSLPHQTAVKRPQTIIFIDESQILMPKKPQTQELTKLEETVATLRYKGVAIVAAGISADLMSHVLVDVGFVAQFRSESKELLRSLALFDREEQIVPQLPQFHALIKSTSNGPKPIHVAVDRFAFTYKAKPNVGSHISGMLAKFELDLNNLIRTKLDSHFQAYETLSKSKLLDLEAEARQFIEREAISTDYSENAIFVTLKSSLPKILHYQQESVAHPLISQYSKPFALAFLKEYLFQLSKGLEFDPKLNLILKNLGKIITTSIEMVETTFDHAPLAIEQIKLTKLEEYMWDFKQFGKLTHSQWGDFIRQVTTGMTSLLRAIVNTNDQPLKLVDLINLAKEQGYLSNKQYRLLNSFRKYRNQFQHEGFEEIYEEMIFFTASLVLGLHSLYEAKKEQLHPIYSIEEP